MKSFRKLLLVAAAFFIVLGVAVASASVQAQKPNILFVGDRLDAAEYLSSRPDGRRNAQKHPFRKIRSTGAKLQNPCTGENL